jgi:hypothetical protein
MRIEHAFMERRVEVLNAYPLPRPKKGATTIVQKNAQIPPSCDHRNQTPDLTLDTQ